MASVIHKGNTVTLSGELPKIGQAAPDFLLAAVDNTNKSLTDYGDKIKILNIVPSLDTGTCAKSARQFNERISNSQNAIVLTISADLPFAARRFCEAEGLKNIFTLSVFRDDKFAKDYGVLQTNGFLVGLLARAIVVVDGSNKVLYTELVPDIAQEPNYDKALSFAIGG